MTTLRDMQQRFANLNLRNTVPTLIGQRNQEISDQLRQQMREGKDGTGNKIEPELASLTYALEKQRLNPLAGFGIADLNLTGAHYAGIRILAITQKTFTLGSTDSKSAALQAKYGTIYALSAESYKAIMDNFLREDIQQYITRITKLAFT